MANDPNIKCILQDSQVQWLYEDSCATDGSIHRTVDSNDHSRSPLFEGSGLPLEHGSDIWHSSLNDSDISSSVIDNSDPGFEHENTNGSSYEKHPKTLRSVSDAPWLIPKRQCPFRGLEPKQDVVGQLKDTSLGSELGFDTSAEFSSQEPATSCISERLAHGYNTCITEEDAEREVRVGRDGHATRWKKDSVLRYIICAETFPSPQLAAVVAREIATAALTWRNIGVSFKKVGRDERATFAIKYCFEPDNCRRDVCARAFFPKTSPSELFVYQLALEPANVHFLANVLAHELGHILGLYHEFAAEKSFLCGQENDRSVMKYYSDLSQLQVGQQDREELQMYYECDEGQHKGIFITDIEPRLYQFPRNDEHGTVDAAQRQRSNSTDYVVANFHPLYCAFALFAFLVCCGFLLG